MITQREIIAKESKEVDKEYWNPGEDSCPWNPTEYLWENLIYDFIRFDGINPADDTNYKK